MKFKFLTKTIASVAIIVAVTFGLEACSSIFNGSMQKVTVNSSESGATVTIDGTNHGNTPATVSLKRGKPHIIEVKKAGFDTYKVTTDNSITGWFWGNLLCGGLVGMVIDLATGNAYDIEPDVVNAQLVKSHASLNNINNGDYSYIFTKEANGDLTPVLTIAWE
jgi:hypothetical protein